MKKFALGTAICASALLGSAAFAQTFTYEVVWQPVESVGGMTGPDGPRYGGGTVTGSYTTTYADGRVATGTVKCVGMRQPEASMFAIHMACSTSEAEGGGSLVYGCNYLGEPGPNTPLGCVGAVEGKEGPLAGRRGSLTMEWYSATNSRGTGQWYSE